MPQHRPVFASTVGELREALARLPADWRIVIQKDREHDRFAPCADADIGYYVSSTAWTGNFLMLYPADCDWPALLDSEAPLNAVCLRPVT